MAIKTHLSHRKPKTENCFGYYLAGLIDGDGHISTIRQIVIVFALQDVSLAYYIKSQLRCGTVRKVKDKNAVLFVISSLQGFIKVINLINGKLRTTAKVERVQSLLKTLPNYKDFYFSGDVSLDLENWWFAGFCDADASFQIKVLTRFDRKEVRLNLQIDQKTDYLLKLIKHRYNGYIGYRKPNDTYYYGSTSFANAYNLIAYFDVYSLQSSKYISYKKWRTCYRLISQNKHLDETGLKQIIALKENLNVFSQ